MIIGKATCEDELRLEERMVHSDLTEALVSW